ncbi:MAG: DUF2807 domain-containing protein [Sphingobacteriaceae bacterium]|nr:MAG: DUF2807 domain-containing protein [Sphingobacteriaceae bacterium]
MKRLIAISILVFCSLLSSAQDQFIVDPNASMRTLNGSFSKIKISHAIKVVITQAETEVIAVSANDEKFTDDILTELDGNTLVIRSKNNSWTGSRSNRQLKVYIAFKKLEEIEVSGASDVITVGAIKQPSLKVDLSGASTLKASLDVSTLSLDMSGASKLILTGTATVLKADMSGASDLEAFGLVVETANLDVSGASDIDINVSRDIKAEASGASSIRYKGTASISNVKTSGASSIKKKD